MIWWPAVTIWILFGLVIALKLTGHDQAVIGAFLVQIAVLLGLVGCVINDSLE